MTVKTSIDIQETLLNQAEILAEHLDISRNHLFQMAVEQFIEQYQNRLNLNEQSRQDTKVTRRIGERQLVVNQGDIYWLQVGAQPEIHHPHVVVQENVFNHSRIHTVVVCALTSNLKRTNLPGNVLLEANEANLPKQSIIEVSKVSTVDKAQLGEYIGSLSDQRINQILAGMRFLHVSFFAR